MPIQYDQQQQLFHLVAGDTSYVIQISSHGYLIHAYWGKKLRRFKGAGGPQYGFRAFSPTPVPEDLNFSLDTAPQEYPAYGNSDFRVPAVQIMLENGSTISDFRIVGHRIYAGKSSLEGLPSTYIEDEDEAESLEIELRDELTKVSVYLTYTVFHDRNVITRSTRIVNQGSTKIKVLRALSMNVDFPEADYDLLHLSGTWANERNVVRRALAPGLQAIESRRGASSHQQNPFLALLSRGASEDQGEVYGVNLVYSGNFTAQVEVDQYKTARLSMGINPFDFSWLLEPGESFQAPEAVMVYSSEGLGGMSRTFHHLYRSRLCRGVYRDLERPVLINNWEATYFDFTTDKIEKIARKGHELGIELFVLDDGWFGKRDNDCSSLGDWFVDRRKLPGGLEDLVQRVTETGMKFGLWFEPEMVSVDSDLYREHPDWCLHVPGRSRSEGRNQLVLDLSRQEVCDEIVRRVSAILSSAPISYVKWDMNRHQTEVGSIALPAERQRETAHRYMLGLYGMLQELTQRFPDVLFESCSGGGGRFDPGMLYYMPQTWTSDNTDAVSRLKIQYGTSLVYPISSMGAHVSAVPNHQVHRMTSLKMRGDVAMSGNFGYELDLTALTEEEQQQVREQTAYYKEVRSLIQFGDFYRLLSPFEGVEAAWMSVAEDQSEALVSYFRVLADPNAPIQKIRLKGLDPEADYQIEGADAVYGGDELMYGGLLIPDLPGDYQSAVWRLKKVN